MQKDIKKLVEMYPNDMRLGEAVRELYWKEFHQNNVKDSWVCEICGESTYEVNYDYLGSGTNHLGCELKYEHKKIEVNNG
tara:strand:+ start:1247 stop:1486 length:240 start_codon:yes stop_codon:yes gene_type:complete